MERQPCEEEPNGRSQLDDPNGRSQLDDPKPPCSKDKDFLLAAYSRASSLDDVFVEWRNKILTLFTTFVAATFVAERYLKENQDNLVWLAGAMGALLGFALIVMDYRNDQIIKEVREVARKLECKMDVEGVYHGFPKRKLNGVLSYTCVIRLLGIAYVSASIYTALR